MNILVTGGTGYIASHALIELAKAGHRMVAVDNLSNSNLESLERVRTITGADIPFYKADCTDRAALEQIFKKHPFDAVIHFAGLKSVGESVANPLLYYRNNIYSTLVLLEVMAAHSVKRLIFSSSATVYGTPEALPLTETSRVGAGISNPYGRSKYMIEEILRDVVVADPSWRITILRYFNPVGAHESGLIGEDPEGPPNNALPYMSQVAAGTLPFFRVFGDDYDTPDGTGVRDYIHVSDVARGHVLALKHEPEPGTTGVYNLCTGRGISVMELLHALEKACGKKIPYKVLPRRPGDLATVYADGSKAAADLGFRAEKTIEDACADSWRWQSQNPHGYKT